MMRAMVGLAALIVGLGLAACEQAPPPGGRSAGSQPATQPAGGVSLEQVKRKAGEAVATAVEYARQKKEEYQKRVEPELARLEVRLAEMKKKVEQAAEEARPGLQERVGELSWKVAVARERLERVKAAGGEAWEEARQGLDAALAELREALGESPASAPATEPSGQ